MLLNESLYFKVSYFASKYLLARNVTSSTVRKRGGILAVSKTALNVFEVKIANEIGALRFLMYLKDASRSVAHCKADVEKIRSILNWLSLSNNKESLKSPVIHLTPSLRGCISSISSEKSTA